MRCVDSLRKRATKFFFTRLIKNVKNKKIRPFRIDKQGLWFETKYGFSVYSNLKDRILELDVNATWEDMEGTFIVHNLKEGAVFVDVGANIGYFSMLAAQQKAGKVLAIEPIPKTYDMLNMNIEYNMFTDVIEPLNIALGGKEHTAKFICSLGPKNHMVYEVEDIHRDLPTINVNVTTLDNLLKYRKEIGRIDFIKVDIEGAEHSFLLEARKTIEVFKPIIMMEIEEHRLTKYNVTAENVFNFMNDLGYKYLSVAEDSITEGNTYVEDLKRGRDFIFYTPNHNLIY
ncbi:MAG TPA: FkbM family methyltransferase [Sedimentisphaerales bacterium]|nr:FkbM family methyltransferase [Sedimentisphaerales bacterium]